MSGRVLRIAPRTKYNYDSLGASGSAREVIARRIDASQYTKADLTVRVHANGINAGSTGVLKVKLYADGSTNEDPENLDFTTGAELAAITIDKDSTAGQFKLSQFTGAMGSMLAVAVEPTQGGQVLSLNATLSIDLALKD